VASITFEVPAQPASISIPASIVAMRRFMAPSFFARLPEPIIADGPGGRIRRPDPAHVRVRIG
jgi:hypothetical protein